MERQEHLYWFPSALRKALQEMQNTLNNLGSQLQRTLNNSHGHVSPQQQQLEAVGGAPSSVEQTLRRQLEAWKRNSAWTEQTPSFKVSVPKGTLCHLDTSFQVGLPPDALFEIITDPGNKRVFKNIQEVTYRKVLEDDGNRQLVEVEQMAIWRFLFFSGTLSIRVLVDQNRHTHSVNFYLAREGFMKKFEGQWSIEPIYVDSPQCALVPSPEQDPVCASSRVASKVNLKQIVQPKLIPPPPLSWYIRGISSRQTEVLIEYLQVEARRLREGKVEGGSEEGQEHSNLSIKSRQVELGSPSEADQEQSFARSRRGRKSSWRLRKPAKPMQVST